MMFGPTSVFDESFDKSMPPYFFHDGGPYNIEISPLICCVNLIPTKLNPFHIVQVVCRIATLEKNNKENLLSIKSD